MNLENIFYYILVLFSIGVFILWVSYIKINPTVLSGFTDLSPADAAIDKTREPYHLLNGILSNAPTDTIGSLTACACNATDFEARTNLTGNYLQRTNNYIHSYPDNCSGPLHDFTMAFYQPQTPK